MNFFNNKPNQHMPWNKGKLIGQKPPLHLKHVWAIRTTLWEHAPASPGKVP